MKKYQTKIIKLDNKNQIRITKLDNGYSIHINFGKYEKKKKTETETLICEFDPYTEIWLDRQNRAIGVEIMWDK